MTAPFLLSHENASGLRSSLPTNKGKEVRVLLKNFVQFIITHIYQTKLLILPPLKRMKRFSKRKEKFYIDRPRLPTTEETPLPTQPLHFGLLFGPAIGFLLGLYLSVLSSWPFVSSL
jgi:hypothetical protein